MIKSALYTIFVLLIIAGIVRLTPYYPRYVEERKPIIAINDLPSAVGLQVSPLQITLIDADAGLDEVVVRIRQRAHSAELLRQQLSGVKEFTISLPLAQFPFVVEDGRADFEIDAFDRSFFSNRATKEFSVIIDRSSPSIESVTTQHNLRQGGTQLIVYRARDKQLLRSGVQVGDIFFEGVKDSECSPDIPPNKDLFCAVYSVPMGLAIEPDQVVLTATDTAGNTTVAPFYNRIARRAFRPTSVSVSNTFFDQLGFKLGDTSCREMRNCNELLTDETVAAAHALLPLNPALAPVPEKAMAKPAATIVSAFGDAMRYVSNGMAKTQRSQFGYEFGGVSDVTAMLSGQVSFIGNAGVLGKVILIDHGFAMHTLYGFLGDIEVHIGQGVERGQRIAQAGDSGVARVPGFYFELLLNRTPVDANEWWTESWYSAHITDKIKESVELASLLSVH